jgi:hypothetical protein
MIFGFKAILLFFIWRCIEYAAKYNFHLTVKCIHKLTKIKNNPLSKKN